MKKLILLLLFIPLVSFGQTVFNDGFKAGYKKGYCLEEVACFPPYPPYPPFPKAGFNSYSDGYAKGVKAGNTARQSKNNREKGGYSVPSVIGGAYSNPKIIQDNSAEIYNQAIQNNAAAMSNMIQSMAASGAFATARQKAQDITSLNGKNINKYKYIVVANVSASKEKEIPKIRKVINQDLSKTNFIIIQNLDNIPEDLILNQDLAMYLYLVSENENWPFKNVILSLTDIKGDIIHQRVVRHDRTAAFLTGLVLQSIKTHPHKFDINSSINEKKTEAANVNSISKADAIEELKELKELLDLELITQEEFDKKSKELKKIILGN